MAWSGLALAALVGLWQTSALIQELTPQGQYSVVGLVGPGQVASFATPPYATFQAWEQAGLTFGKLNGWLWYCLAFDAVLILSLAALAVVILRRYSRSRPSVWLTAAALGGLTLEALVGAVSLLLHPHGTALSVLVWLLHLITIAKWLLIVALLTWVIYKVHESRQEYKSSVHDRDPTTDHSNETGIYADLRRLGHALEVQRFSLIVVALLTLIAIGPPLSDTLEQLPDVQRAWLDAGSLMGLRQMAVALVTELLIAYLLFRLGRMRKKRADAKFTGRPDDARKSVLHLPWIIIPAAVGLLAWLFTAIHQAQVSLPRLLAFVGTLLVIYVVSMLLQLLLGSRIPDGRGLPPREDIISEAARIAGDALAFAVLAIMPIGLIRSFTAEVLAVPGPGWEPIATFWVAMTASLALPLTVPPLLSRLARRRATTTGQDAARSDEAALSGGQAAGQTAGQTALPGSGIGERFRQWRKRHIELAGSTVWLWTAMAPFLIADVFLVHAPLSVAPWLGPLATAEIAIGTLAGLLGALAYLAQMTRPLALFGLLKMNVTPVITIVLVVALIGGIVDRNSALHQVRGPVTQEAGQRPTLNEALAAWRSQLPASCALPAGQVSGHQVRVFPLIQVAASGGGIRAAWWAVKVLGTISDSVCGARDVFAVSSVSGGSVGTAVLVSGISSAHAGGVAGTRIASMAGPQALSAGLDGFMLRDALAGYTGIDVAASGMPGSDRYPDRAALIELEWQREDPSLARPFPLTDPALPWALFFNSTSVSTGCRAVISNVTLPRAAQIPNMGLTCGVGTRGPTGSYDFFARLRCMRGIATATAAMLSARFTYVTPTGTITGCDKHSGTFGDQLVDGGYGDSTGLSTLVNLAPSLVARVRQYNASSVADARAGQPITLIMPVTVYLENSLQRAPQIIPPSRTPEIYAPKAALSAGPTTELRSPDSLLENMLAATGSGQWISCRRRDAVCLAVVRAADMGVPDQLITVAPREYPGVSVPLGWLLSRVSQEALDGALARDIWTKACTPGSTGDPYCLPGLGGMADLLRLVRLSPRSAATSLRS